MHSVGTISIAKLLTLQNIVVHPKDTVKDEEKTELIYCVPCKNCSSSYIGETGRKFGLRIKKHKKEVDSFTDGIQSRASIGRERERDLAPQKKNPGAATDWDIGDNVETSLFTQLKICYLMTTFRCHVLIVYSSMEHVTWKSLVHVWLSW